MKIMQKRNSVIVDYQQKWSEMENGKDKTLAADIWAKYMIEYQMFDPQIENASKEDGFLTEPALVIYGKHIEELYRFVYPHINELRNSLKNYTASKVPDEIKHKLYAVSAIMKHFEHWFEDTKYYGDPDRDEEE